MKKASEFAKYFYDEFEKYFYEFDDNFDGTNDKRIAYENWQDTDRVRDFMYGFDYAIQMLRTAEAAVLERQTYKSTGIPSMPIDWAQFLEEMK